MRYPPRATNKSRLIWNSGDVKRLSIGIPEKLRFITLFGFLFFLLCEMVEVCGKL
jgi:hypothetical protein